MNAIHQRGFQMTVRSDDLLLMAQFENDICVGVLPE